MKVYFPRTIPHESLPLPADELFLLEWKIAQRADELSRRLGVDRAHALENWRTAEREIWGFSEETPKALAVSHRANFNKRASYPGKGEPPRSLTANETPPVPPGRRRVTAGSCGG